MLAFAAGISLNAVADVRANSFRIWSLNLACISALGDAQADAVQRHVRLIPAAQSSGGRRRFGFRFLEYGW